MAGIGFSVMHDANHGGYSTSGRVNRILSFSLDFIGASSHVWRHKHNVLHHTYTNISGLDADLEPGPLLRFATWQPRRAYHRFQHLYVWLLYAVFPLRWFFIDDFRDMLSGSIGGANYPRPRGWSLVGALAGKAVFYSWAFVIPAVLHPTWWLIPLWLLASFTLGNVLATVFQLAHCVEGVDFHQGQGQAMDSEWAVHQVSTTMDFAPSSALLSWYLGGLNFQVEHHLFPRVCHMHYPAISRIVEETCRAHGISYRSEPSLLVALGANVRWLRDLGRGAPVHAAA
jgi:linoleoyl-CoA desaturase